MPNPNNNIILRGSIKHDPFYKKTKQGEVFACEFVLNVRRNYRNKGEYLYDDFDIRYEGVNHMQYAMTNFARGVKVALCGSLVPSKYTKEDGSEVKKLIVLAEDVQIEKPIINKSGICQISLPL